MLQKTTHGTHWLMTWFKTLVDFNALKFTMDFLLFMISKNIAKKANYMNFMTSILLITVSSTTHG